jgi:hypothetical protein
MANGKSGNGKKTSSSPDSFNQKESSLRSSASLTVADVRLRLLAWCSGLLLMFGLLKFGTPVILQDQIESPQGLIQWLFFPWPIQTAYMMFAVLGMAAVRMLPFRVKAMPKWLWLPLAWLAWQFASAFFTIDQKLTHMVLAHFMVLVGLFYIGFFMLSKNTRLKGVAGPATFGLILAMWTATEQKFGGLEATKQAIPQSPYFDTGMTWNQVYPQAFLEKTIEDQAWLQSLRADEDMLQQTAQSLGLVPLLNPQGAKESQLERDLAFLEKIGKNRVFGTFGGYPNALAAAIWLLLPMSLVCIWQMTHRLQKPSRALITGLVAVWAVACVVWSGSKGGWLIGMLSVGLLFLLSRVSRRVKAALVLALVIGGSFAFAWKYQAYFEKGATSVGARFEYWKAGWHTSFEHPLLGSGPGTFMRAFAKVKPDDAEMTRLTHNDYLQQASDAGWPSAIMYLLWIGGSLWIMRPKSLANNLVYEMVWIGLVALAFQNTIEFGLYIPALSWPFFLLLGWLWGQRLPQPGPKPAFDQASSDRASS